MSNFQDLTDAVNDLTNYMESSRRLTIMFSRDFNRFVRESRDFFRNWRTLVPGGPNPPPPPPPPDDDESSTSNVLRSYLNSAGNAMIQQVKAMDDLQARAMATNTTLEKMNIPGLGIRMSKLAGEILDLREQGFKNLNNSTLGLMSTMKLTSQNTGSLKGFLANTSLNLRLNSTQVQKMALELNKTAVSFGMSQEKIFESVNKLSQAISTASLFGKGGQTAAAFGEVAAQIGDRATEELKIVAEFLTGIGNESQAMIAGTFDIQNKFLSASKAEQVKLTKEAVAIFNATFRARTAGIGSDFAGKRQVEGVANQFGGMAVVRAFQGMESAFQDASVATTENNQTQELIRKAQEKYADQMETVAARLQTIITKLPEGTLGAVGTVAGAGQSILGLLGAGSVLKNLIPTISLAAIKGLVGGPIGVGVAVAGTLAATYFATKSFSERTAAATEETNRNVDKTNQLLNPNKETEQVRSTYSLIDSINNMIRKLGPDTDTTNQESLRVQKQMVDRLSQINENVSARSMQATQAQMVTR
jgi:hypothetical protein